MPDIQTKIITHDEEGLRLDRWFKRHFPEVSHITLEKALRKGHVRVDGSRVKAGYRVVAGQAVRIPPLKVSENQPKITKNFVAKPKDVIAIQQSVLFKNKDVLVINKPHGLATQGGNKVKVSVDALCPHLQFECNTPPRLVHRLDKDTSGVLMLARNVATASKLGEMLRRHDVQKTYLAVVVGMPELKQGTIDLPLNKLGGAGHEKMSVDPQHGKKAITYYKVIDRAGSRLALLEVMPVTGRTHQIRVHLASVGIPILGDGKYGGQEAFVNGLGKNLHLHAASVVLEQFKGKSYRFDAPVPDHFTQTCKEVGLELPH